MAKLIKKIPAKIADKAVEGNGEGDKPKTSGGGVKKLSLESVLTILPGLTEPDKYYLQRLFKLSDEYAEVVWLQKVNKALVKDLKF